VFPVRYKLDSYILFRRNSVFKGLSGSQIWCERVEWIHLARDEDRVLVNTAKNLRIP
jgi:hypothetical protein